MKLVSFSNNGQESFGILGNSGLHPVFKNFKKDFPDLVNRNYICNDDILNPEHTYSIDNKLVIGLMHNPKICNEYDLDYINNHEITGPMCEFRNSMPTEELNFGMGDIFINLAQ